LSNVLIQLTSVSIHTQIFCHAVGSNQWCLRNL